MLKKLPEYEKQLRDIDAKLSLPETMQDMKIFKSLNQERSHLAPIVDELQHMQSLLTQISDAEQILHDENDAEMLEKFPFYAEITKLLQEGAIYYAPPIAEYAQLADILSFALSEAIAGSKDPREALDKAANDVENMMRKAGYYK